jgi:hypothetical protein
MNDERAMPSAWRLWGLLALLIALGWSTLQARTIVFDALGPLAGTPVHDVADMQRRIAQDPAEWIGRTLLVRGRIVSDRTWGPPDSIVTHMDLFDVHPVPDAPGLPLAWGSDDNLVVSLRGIPLLGRLAPPPQAVHWGTPATYRIRLQSLPVAFCTAAPCIEAILLDAAPGTGAE